MDSDFNRRFQRANRRIGQTEVKAPGLYEEGTWTPTLVGAGTAGTFTYVSTAGTYTRIGNMVYVRGRVALSAVTVAPTGNLSIHGLPYAAGTVSNGTPGGVWMIYWSIVNLGTREYLGGWIQNGQSQIDLAISDSGGAGAIFLTGAIAGVAANTDFVFVGEYEATAPPSGGGGGGGGGGGTVTSVGLALPAEFSVSGSPVVGAGTLTGAWVNESANTVLAGPTSGGAATPAFRALVSGDIPQLTITDTSGGKVIEAPHQYGWVATGALTVATFAAPVYYVRSDETVVGWYAYVVTAPSGSAATFDIEYSTNNGSTWATIFSSAPSISAGANFGTSTSGISVSTLNKGYLLRAKCTAANSAADLTLHLLTKMR